MTPVTPDELQSVLDAFSPVLKSIDLRTVVVTHPSGEHWLNLITSIIASEKTVPEVQNEHKNLPAFRNNQFAIFLQALPFDYSIFEQIIYSKIKILTPYGWNVIHFRKFDPLKLKVGSITEWIDGSLNWTLRSVDRSQEKEREELWSIVNDQNKEAILRNYINIQELIKKTLRIDFSIGDRKDFELVIPSLAKIKTASFKDKKFLVEIRKLVGLRDLQLNLVLKRPNGYTSDNIIWKDIYDVGEGKRQLGEKFCLVEKEFEIDDLLPYDSMDVKLIHRNSALTLDQTHKEAPLENIVEPFLKTLYAFCPSEKFKKMLLEPEKYGKNPDKIFENAVTWLLSLTGYSTIHLGVKIKAKKGNEKFDVLRAESGYEIGCADIIAYEENERLLLIDCDLGLPDDKKIQKLFETVKHFADSKKYRQLRIIPVFVTPKEYNKLVNNLTVVSHYTLELILKKLAGGNRKEARDTFCGF